LKRFRFADYFKFGKKSSLQTYQRLVHQEISHWVNQATAKLYTNDVSEIKQKKKPFIEMSMAR